jgi:hypothetical protein
VWRLRPHLATIFIVCAVGTHYLDTPVSRSAFVVEMRSSTNAVAQLYYDVGRGMNEVDSVRIPVSQSTGLSSLRFPLPHQTIRAIRFDPIDGPGTFSVRRAYVVGAFGRTLRQFASNDLTALSQIATRFDGMQEVVFSTVSNANDPMLQIALTNPLQPAGLGVLLALIAVRLIVALIVTAAVGAAIFAARSQWTRAVHFLDRLALAVSDPYFLTFDRLAIGFLLALVTLFTLAVSAGLHGSAMSLYRPMSGPEQNQHPIAGRAKPIRSDEWAFHTPAILHQIYRPTTLDAEISDMGRDYASLIGNIPVKHVTTIFRPQFWGFLFLAPAYGFSFYWQFKAVLLSAGVFLLLLLMTHSSRIAMVGTLWYVLSPYTQWTYSWPSLLPEMVGAFCLTMFCLFYMSTGRRGTLLTAAAIVCASCMINFALCAYIPHQIPLVWLGVFLCIWWVWARWDRIFTRDGAGPRAAALATSLLLVGVGMWAFLHDAGEAVSGIADTVYPGRRRLAGGTYPLSMLGSHFFSFWADDRRFPMPQAFGNICECAGFLWLAPVTLFCVSRLRDGEGRRQRAYWILVTFGALLFIWLTLPVPEAVGRALLMDKTGSGRSMHVLGFVNIVLVSLYLSLARVDDSHGRWRRAFTLATAVFGSVFPAFLLVNSSVGGFLTTGQVIAAAAYATALTVAVVGNWFRVLSTLLIVPHFAAFGFVNPVDRGLKVFESAPLFQFVRSSPDLLRHRWIIYSDSIPDSGFFSAIGCDVVTGLDYVPNVKALSVFGPKDANGDLVNSSRFVVGEPKLDDGPAAFELIAAGVMRLRVSPFDPGLKSMGVRYAAFRSQPPSSIEFRLKPLIPSPISGFWLYELP